MANKRFELDQGLKIGGLTIDEATGDITTTGNIVLTGAGQMTMNPASIISIEFGGTGVSTQQAAITALTGTQTSGHYLRSNGTNSVLAALDPLDLSSAVPFIKGGTGQTSQQAAINALVGSQTTGYYLRSNGTNVTMSSLAAADISGTVAVAQGGTGQTTAAAALTALLPLQTDNSGKFLTTNGTSATWSNSTSQAIAITNSTTSTSTSTGALTVAGGVGVTGNVHAAKLVGNVSTSNISSTDAGTINITGNLIPTTDVTYDLGSPSKRFNTLYLAGNTIDLGGALITTTDVSLLLTAKSGATFEISGNADEKVSGSFANLTVESNVASSSTTSGALVITGGLGVSGSAYIGQLYDNGNRVVTSIASSGVGNLTINANVGPTASISLTTVGSASTYGNASTVPVITTDAYGRVVSVSTSTVNLANDLTVGSGLELSSGTTFNGSSAKTISSTDTLQTVTSRGATTTTALTITNAANSTSTSTGALKVTGGVGVAGNINAASVYSNNYFYANGAVLSSSSGGVAGVSSITGTTNQVTASASTGDITLSLPQNIHSAASPTFGSLTLTGQATASTFVDKKSAVSIASNLLTLDLSTAATFEVALNQNITELTISNTPSAANTAVQFVVIVTADGTQRSIAWPAAVMWPNGTAPTLTATLNKKDIFVFISTNGGTSWAGITAGQNY